MQIDENNDKSQISSSNLSHPSYNRKQPHRQEPHVLTTQGHTSDQNQHTPPNRQTQIQSLNTLMKSMIISNISPNQQELMKKNERKNNIQAENIQQTKQVQNRSLILKKLLIYNVSIWTLIQSILDAAMIQITKYKQNILSVIYKCKLSYFSSYNYQYAVYLTNILNNDFNWCTIQIIPLDRDQQQNDDRNQQYQIIYRFDSYQDDETKISQIINQQKQAKDQKATCNFLPSLTKEQMIRQQLQPLLELLTQQYEQKPIIKFIQTYKQTKNSNTSIAMLNDLSEQSKQKIDFNLQKFELRVRESDVQTQKLISVFQTNIVINMFLRTYHLNHDIKFYAQKFKNYMKITFAKYPYIQVENDQQ